MELLIITVLFTYNSGKQPFMSPWENEFGFDSPDLADQNMVLKGGLKTIYRGDILFRTKRVWSLLIV